MSGKLTMDIYLADNTVAHFTVDSVHGWSYSGSYLLVHTEHDGETVTRPYFLGEIDRIVTSPVSN